MSSCKNNLKDLVKESSIMMSLMIIPGRNFSWHLIHTSSYKLFNLKERHTKLKDRKKVFIENYTEMHLLSSLKIKNVHFCACYCFT